MKLKSKIIKIVLIGLCLLNVNSFTVFAEQDMVNNVVTEDSDSSRAVSTGYKYIKFNGVCFRRLWNYTEGEWIDPEWTRCPASNHNH